MWSIELLPLTDEEALATLRMLGVNMNIDGLKKGNYQNSQGQILKIVEI